MWALLAFFMYDDVFRWLGNPLLLYPIVLMFSFLGMCVSTGIKYFNNGVIFFYFF